MALLGPNGAGKTTVLRAIMGLVKHRRGAIQVGGADVIALPPHRIAERLRRHRARRPPPVHSITRSKTTSSSAPCICGATSTACSGCSRSVYDLFPVLQDYRRRRSSFLSGGEQQMVAIGRMLMSDPEILLLDEPSVALVAGHGRRRRQGTARIAQRGRVPVAGRAAHRRRGSDLRPPLHHDAWRNRRRNAPGHGQARGRRHHQQISRMIALARFPLGENAWAILNGRRHTLSWFPSPRRRPFLRRCGLAAPPGCDRIAQGFPANRRR